MAYRLLGKNFTPPDIQAKVTGSAKFSEDFRAEGMLFCKLLTSPMPHAMVRNIDASEALAMEGVVAVLTADEVPLPPAPGDEMLSNEPKFVGQPILAVAAEDEWVAAEALEKIKVDLQPMPFVVDPLDSLYPDGPNARQEGNVANRKLDLQTIKWSAKDFAKAGEGQLPMGKPAEEWTYGDLEAGFNDAALVLEENFVTATNSHHSMEPRSAMAYWQNGKCHLFGSTQSSSFSHRFAAKYVGVEPQDLVYVTEYCGGGFGSKATSYPYMAIPAHLAKKTGRPVMLRITRAEEYFLGSARAGYQGRVKLGFRADGKITAADVYVVAENGPNTGFPDFRNCGNAMSIVYQPENMRWRGIPVLTNTPPCGAQRGPGENQTATAIEPILDKAARELGIDRLAIRKINAPDSSGKYGPKRQPLTSAHLVEALDRGAEMFNWTEKAKLSGQKNGSKVIGVGIGQAYHSAGANGFDGLVRLTPDGTLHIHSGVGNLGTYSYASTSRVAAEVLNCDWESCVIHRGDSAKGLPFVLGQFGSNTSFTTTRAVYAAAIDAKDKLLELAVSELGGTADDYELKDHKVVAKSDNDKAITYAQAAELAIKSGGKFSGEELPEDINPMTQASAKMVAGTGLMGVAKDTLPKEGVVPGLACAFVQIELDTDTGKFEIVDLQGVADCGTVMHPQGLAAQIRGGAIMGIGMACMERHVYDPEIGVPGATGFYQAKPPSYLDTPVVMGAEGVDIADPQNPVGAKGVGEPVMGSAAAALVCAISDALGGHVFNRTPIVPDMIINVAAGQPQSHKPLQVNTV